MPLSMLGLFIIIGFFIIALFAPFIATHDPNNISLSERMQPPSSTHFFGTDALGRSIFSRVIYGARVSLLIGFIVILVSGFIGIVLGLVAGYFGGLIDESIMRLTDMFLAFPGILLAMAFVVAMKPSVESTVLALAFVSWPGYARLVRAQVLSVKEETYIEAARAAGENSLSIIVNHILPNILPPLLVQITLNLGHAIMRGSTLGFIGLGAAPPTPEWGVMAAEGRKYILNEWWICSYPAIAITLVVIAFNLFGDGLRDALDPRLRYK